MLLRSTSNQVIRDTRLKGSEGILTDVGVVKIATTNSVDEFLNIHITTDRRDTECVKRLEKSEPSHPKSNLLSVF